MLRIQEISKEKGMTMQALAEKMGVTYQALYANVSGNPTLSKLSQIAEVLGVEITELFKTEKATALGCPKCGARLKLVEE